MRNKIKIVLSAATVIILIYFISAFVNTAAAVKYADFECPVCNSDFVLDYGTDFEGTHNYQCYECKVQFSIDE
jgi:transposase-like protein